MSVMVSCVEDTFERISHEVHGRVARNLRESIATQKIPDRQEIFTWIIDELHSKSSEAVNQKSMKYFELRWSPWHATASLVKHQFKTSRPATFIAVATRRLSRLVT